MKSWKGIAILICLWLSGGLLREDAPAQAPRDEKPGTESADDASDQQGAADWKFKHEQDWLVDEIGRDLTEMVLYAKNPAQQVSGALEFKVILSTDDGKNNEMSFSAKALAGEVAKVLPLKHHLWAPENYTLWVQALFDTWKLAKPEALPALDKDLAKRLTVPSNTLLMAEGRRISRELSQNPLNAELHEEAALVLGSLALREAAGPFSDTRHTLCRMTTHLAMAAALHDKPGWCGQLAEAVQLALVNRQAEALEKVALFPPEQKAWANALKMRCTGDWRIVSDPSTASLLEQMENARAIVKSVGTGELSDFLQKAGVPRLPMWNRLVMEEPASIQDGHLFVRESLKPELAELVDDRNAWFGKPLQKPNLVVEMNEAPARCVVKTSGGRQAMEVLGWGDMAAFHQRHICLSLWRISEFFRDRYGVPPLADQFDKAVRVAFGRLRLYPIVLERTSHTAEEYAEGMSGARTLCRAQPELIPPAIWAGLRESSSFGPLNKQIPEASWWFNAPLPFGTAQDCKMRSFALPLNRLMDLAAWEGLRELAPYDHAILRRLQQKKFGNYPTPAQVQESVAAIGDYHLGAMVDAAQSCVDDPAAYQKWMQKICALNASYYFVLADYLAKRGLEDAAATAYQAGFKEAKDRVMAASNSGWLVDYYFDHDRKEDALVIAKDAASTYAQTGLYVMGRLMERMQKYDEAVKYFGQISQRYNDLADLRTFYRRRRESIPRSTENVEKITRQMFPLGMEKAQVEDFSGLPKDGADLTEVNDKTATVGLHKGDVIVALDGWRVHSMEQYFWLNGLATVQEMRFVIWDGNEYRELKATLPGRDLGVRLETQGAR